MADDTADPDRDRGPLAPWRVENSVHVIRDRWVSLRADRCRTEDGVLVDPFYVLEYPDWVQVVAFDTDDHLILTEQYRHGLGIVSLELPTGGMERGDAGPIDAARRELAEETGYAAEAWRHVVSLAPNPANQTNRCHVVLALGAVRVGPAQDDPTERIRVSRVPRHEVAGLVRSGAIVQAMHVAALALALASLDEWPSLQE